MSSELALSASCLLLVTAFAALFSKKVSISLITLFYSSVTLGVVFTLYGDALIGLLHLITFAGVVSVMLLTAVLMTGEPTLDIGANGVKVTVIGAAVVIAALASSALLTALPSGSLQVTSSPASLLEFVWKFRPWDLLILLMVFASSMIVVVNLFSRDEQ